MNNLIAHRSLDKHQYPENSLLASLFCLKQKYILGIEIDVRLTKDKKFIMYHNYLYNLKRITNLKYKELANIDKLEDLLKQIKSPKIILLDLKCEDINVDDYLKRLLRLLKKYPLNYYLCSFNYDLTKKLARLTNYPVGLFISDLINKKKNYNHLSFLALSRHSYFDIPFDTKMVWTVNDTKTIYKYQYIITDKPYLLS